MRALLVTASLLVAFGCAGAPGPTQPNVVPAPSSPSSPSSPSGTGTVAADPPVGPRADPAPSGPNRLTVHVDNVRPDKAAQFEAARVRFVEDLKQRGVDDWRGHYFKIGETRFYSVIPFRTFGELDALARARSDAQAKMKGVIEEYDRLADEGLVFPHGNELWTERADLAYLPTGRLLEAAVEMVVEDVDPTCDYAAAWKPVAERLAAAKYPFERRAFASSYGTGKLMVFWLGDGLKAARPPVKDVSCVLRSESMPARFMEKMSLP